MQFDAEHPAYFAWLTNETGKQQEITGVGVECNEDQLQKLAEIQKLVGYVRGFVNDALGVMKCFNEVHSLDADLATNAAQVSTFALNIPATILAHADAQQKLDNLLAAGSAFVYRAQTRIRKKFGEDSAEFAEFEAARRYEYDNKFSFRVMQNLRNYSQHEEAPISLMPTNIRRNDETSFTASTSVLLDKKKLIDSNRVQARVRRELADLSDDKIDLMPFIDKYYESFMIITKKAATKIAAECQERCQPFMEIYGKQSVENVSIPIILRPRKMTADTTNFLISYPPMQELAVFDYTLNRVLADDAAEEEKL